MRIASYWIKLGLVYAGALAGALLYLFVAGIFADQTDRFILAVLVLPAVVGPIIFGIALARSPWLRHGRVSRVIVIVLGTLTLSALYLLMYGAYGQGIALYARHAREYLRNAF